MIKYATAILTPGHAGHVLIRVARDRNSKSIINRVLKSLLTSDVSLSCLNRSVSEQKLNLFEFAAVIMAKARTGAPLMPHAA
jgi:hypothetical protein